MPRSPNSFLHRSDAVAVLLCEDSQFTSVVLPAPALTIDPVGKVLGSCKVIYDMYVS
jgi:hypothetical protein